MKTVEENRRDWLEMLIAVHGSIAELNIKLERDRTDATLSQIRNKSPHHKTGKPRTMGSDVARDIEEKLGLEIGSLDYPPALPSHVVERQQIQSVQEPKGAYRNPLCEWPFLTIKDTEWISIHPDTRKLIEQQIRALIPTSSENAKTA